MNERKSIAKKSRSVMLGWEEQYRHPSWQKRRLERLDAAMWACEECGAELQQLHVHHKLYIKDRAVWDYSNEELSVLCDKCHKEIHIVLSRIKESLAHAGHTTLLSILGYIEALVCESSEIECGNIFIAEGMGDALGISADSVSKLCIDGKFHINRFLLDRAATIKGGVKWPE